jgi:hypothetical protein
MGAYYQAALTRDNGHGEERVRYSTWSIGEGAKLAEHYYIGNDYVNGVMAELIDAPAKLVWLCDYHDEEGETWEDYEERDLPDDTLHSSIENNRYFVLNLDKKAFIDMEKLWELHGDNDGQWPIHPAPVLANSDYGSMGGGDHHGEIAQRASWKGDTIEVVLTKDDVPQAFSDITEEVVWR